MRKVPIEPKKGKKMPVQIAVSDKYFVFIGQPPFTIGEHLIPLVSGHFTLKTGKQQSEVPNELQT